MSPELSRAMLPHRISDLRREAMQSAVSHCVVRQRAVRQCAVRQCAAPSQPQAVRPIQRARAYRVLLMPQLRSRIGFVLVEAGLRLLCDSSVRARPGLD